MSSWYWASGARVLLSLSHDLPWRDPRNDLWVARARVDRRSWAGRDVDPAVAVPRVLKGHREGRPGPD